MLGHGHRHLSGTELEAALVERSSFGSPATRECRNGRGVGRARSMPLAKLVQRDGEDRADVLMKPAALLSTVRRDLLTQPVADGGDDSVEPWLQKCGDSHIGSP